jgi:phage terminase large subunit
VEIQLPEKAQALFKPARYKCLWGGRGSAKSQSIARALLIQGASEKHKILCAREIQKSINESVHSLLEEQIEQLGLQAFYTVQKTQITGRNGTEIFYAGLRTNISNIKSIPNISRVWVEEAQTVSKASMDVLIPTVRAKDSEIWLSFNPELEDDYIYQNFVVTPPEDSIIVNMNWRDNPFFPEVLQKEMQSLRRKNEEDYQHIWEGKPRQAINGAIFANELQKAAMEQRLTKVPVQSGVPVHTFWDLGMSDNTAIWFVQIIGMEYRLLDYYEASGERMAHYIEVLAERAYNYGEHCLPHDADHEQLAAHATIKQQLQNALRDNPALGKTVRIVPRIPKKALAIDAARSIFDQCIFDKAKTQDGLACLRHYAYAVDADTGRVSKEPKHDAWSHGADAFLCFAQHYKRPQTAKPQCIMMQRRY